MGPGTSLAVDFYLSTENGKTRVRLVQSAFGASEGWDDLFDGIKTGSTYFLQNLRVYIEKHLGRVRRLISDRIEVDTPRQKFWRHLLADAGGSSSVARVPEGGRFNRAEALGVRDRARGGGGADRGPGAGPAHPRATDAMLFIELEGKSDKLHVGDWFSVYDEAQAKVVETPAKRALRDRPVPPQVAATGRIAMPSPCTNAFLVDVPPLGPNVARANAVRRSPMVVKRWLRVIVVPLAVTAAGCSLDKPNRSRRIPGPPPRQPIRRSCSEPPRQVPVPRRVPLRHRPRRTPSAGPCALPALNPVSPVCTSDPGHLLGAVEAAIKAVTQKRPALFDFADKSCDDCYKVLDVGGTTPQSRRSSQRAASARSRMKRRSAPRTATDRASSSTSCSPRITSGGVRACIGGSATPRSSEGRSSSRPIDACHGTQLVPGDDRRSTRAAAPSKPRESG